MQDLSSLCKKRKINSSCTHACTRTRSGRSCSRSVTSMSSFLQTQRKPHHVIHNYHACSIASFEITYTYRIDKPFCWPFKMCTRVVVRWRRSISPTTATRGHTKNGPTKPRCRRDNLVHINLNHRAAADKSHVLDLVDRSYVEIENRIAHMNSITRTQRSTYAWFTL
jgi:hypothetical protein